MTNTDSENTQDEKPIKQLINRLRRPAGLTHENVVEGLSRNLGWKFDISRYNRRLDGTTKFSLDELLALIRIFTADEIEPRLRCKAEDAFRLFSLSDMPAHHYPSLKPFFEDEYNEVAKRFLEIVENAGGQSGSTLERNMPHYPEMMIGRDDDLIRLMSWLGIGDNAQRKPVTVLRGWPGVGKTTFINRLIYDEAKALNLAFPDGVLWGTLGIDGVPILLLRAWGRQLGLEDAAAADVESDAIQSIRNRIQNKKVLFIIDDVWHKEHAHLLLKLQTDTTTLLFTTRFTDLAESVTDNIYILGVLTPEQSKSLLSLIAKEAIDAYADRLDSLIETLEGLPLALRVAGALFRERYLISDLNGLIDELEQNFRKFQDLAPADRFDEKLGQTPTIGLLFRRSIQTLPEREQLAFACVGSFAPKPATFDIDDFVDVAELEDGPETVRILIGRGLLELLVERRLQMHYTLVMYAKHLLETDLYELSEA